MSGKPSITQLIIELLKGIFAGEREQLKKWINENLARWLRSIPWPYKVVVGVLICWVIINVYTPTTRLNGFTETLQDSHPSLSLSNGRRFLLDSLDIGKTLQEDGWILQKTGQHAVNYVSLPAAGGDHSAATPRYHTFNIPYGESWQIVLPDGSKVQLNAGAELSYMVYPHAETSIRRNVILKGEAFFDIATDIHRPFTVTTEKGVITVLSTRFNVRYYPKKDDFRVTLAQGAVKLQHDGDPVILHPGEEARIDKATKGACVVQAVDTALAFSWRSEKFDFSGKNIGQMMNDIEEWHGLEKSYFEESVDTVHPNLLGGGHIAKTFLLDDLLKQITDDFYFRCDGKRIVISKNHPAK